MTGPCLDKASCVQGPMQMDMFQNMKNFKWQLQITPNARSFQVQGPVGEHGAVPPESRACLWVGQMVRLGPHGGALLF